MNEKDQNAARIKQFRDGDDWFKVTPKPQTFALSTASPHLAHDVRPHHNLNDTNQVSGNYASNRQMPNHSFLGL